ncbi:MAG: hypothetical protein ACWGQW_19840, partial [bacterium]
MQEDPKQVIASNDLLDGESESMIQYQLTKREIITNTLRRWYMRRESKMIFILSVIMTFSLYHYGPVWAAFL